MSSRPPSLAVRAFASGCGTGYIPFASGTFGSAFALALYWFIPGFERPLTLLAIILLSVLAGIPAARRMEATYGHDPAEVTIDEVVGMWVSLFLLPRSMVIAGAAFLIFRLFDIIKPYPARKIDSMRGGFGIVMDDVVVAIYTNLLLEAALLFDPLRKILL